jgi:riboflavin synthase
VFTGIVLTTARLKALERRSEPILRVEPATALTGVHIGDSVAVNGICLTLVDEPAAQLVFNLTAETLKRSNLGDLPAGAPLNIELPLRPDAFLGGHLVSGHIDGTARVKSVNRSAGRTRLLLTYRPAEWRDQLVAQGSVTLNGVSLTLVEVHSTWFAVEIIPHTWATTNLRTLRVGERVNLELDLLGKYIYNFFRNRQGSK